MSVSLGVKERCERISDLTACRSGGEISVGIMAWR